MKEQLAVFGGRIMGHGSAADGTRKGEAGLVLFVTVALLALEMSIGVAILLGFDPAVVRLVIALSYAPGAALILISIVRTVAVFAGRTVRDVWFGVVAGSTLLGIAILLWGAAWILSTVGD